PRVAFEFAEHFPAVDAGQDDVEQDRVGHLDAGGGEPVFFASRDGGGLSCADTGDGGGVACAVEVGAHELRGGWVVLDDEDVSADARLGCSVAGGGGLGHAGTRFGGGQGDGESGAVAGFGLQLDAAAVGL